MKIIACDYDETLFRRDYITNEDKAAIHKWRAAGNLFGINTARSYPSIKRELLQWGFENDYLVCSDGCTVFDRNENLIFEHSLSREDTLTVAHKMINFNAARIELRCGKIEWGVYMDGNAVQSYMLVLDKNDIDKTVSSSNGIAAVFPTTEEATEFIKFIQSEYEDCDFTIISDWTVADIRPRGISKTEGMYKFLESICSQREDVIAIGDGISDVPLIREFNGYSMVHAEREVQECAAKLYNTIAELIDEHI